VSSAGGGTFIWQLVSAERFGLCPGSEAFASNWKLGFALVVLVCPAMAWKADWQRESQLEEIKMATVQWPFDETIQIPPKTVLATTHGTYIAEYAHFW
jgi:hypothetical protein